MGRLRLSAPIKLMLSTASLANVVVSLVAISAMTISLHSAEADRDSSQPQATADAGTSDPLLTQTVALPDPHGIGERLVLIDHLRQQGLTVPPGSTLTELRHMYWQQQQASSANTLIDHQQASQADLVSEIDRLRRALDHEQSRRLAAERAVDLLKRQRWQTEHSSDQQTHLAQEVTRLNAELSEALQQLATAQAKADSTILATTAAATASQKTTPTTTTSTAPQTPAPPPDLISQPQASHQNTPQPANPTSIPLQPAPVTTVTVGTVNPPDTRPASWALWLYMMLLLVVGLLLWHFRHRLITWRAGRQVRSIIRQALGPEHQVWHNIMLYDRHDRAVTFDHLVIGPQGVAVIVTMAYAGTITGEKHHAHWQQYISQADEQGNRESISFLNPYRETYRQARVISNILGLAPEAVHEVIVFCRASELALVDCDEVIHPGRLASHLRDDLPGMMTKAEQIAAAEAIAAHQRALDRTQRHAQRIHLRRRAPAVVEEQPNDDDTSQWAPPQRSS